MLRRCRDISLPPSWPLAMTPPSQREAREFRACGRGGTDSHASVSTGSE
nr:MAG TPA: hypothetical protein [Caudoviricetes sp.]